LNLENELIIQRYMPWANLYFYTVLVLNFIYTDIKVYTMTKRFHFAFRSLAIPMIIYFIINVQIKQYTIQPWIDWQEATESRDKDKAKKVIAMQIIFLIAFKILENLCV
jgi:hypothetical protein